MLVVSDTTPIIAMMKAKCLYLLKSLFNTVLIPQAVYNELVDNQRYKQEANIIEQNDFFKVLDVRDKEAINLLRKEEKLDLGESEAITLSHEQGANLLLMDEQRGRKVAEKLGINITGTIGILLHANNVGILSKAETLNCLQLMTTSNIRFSRQLIDYVKQNLV